MSIETYPLCWPAGYPRTRSPKASRFETGRRDNLVGVRRELEDEVRRLGGGKLIISTNMRTRLDGGVYSNAKEPEDAGVAVYFDLKGRQVVLCCDRWKTVRENVRAITLSIDSMRGMDRWGVSQILERAFTGFVALPAPAGQWWEVLDVAPEASIDEIKAAYRRAMKLNHPDAGGSAEEAARINHAYQVAMHVGREAAG